MKNVIAASLLIAASLGAAPVVAANESAALQAETRVLVFWASWCGACKPLLDDLKAAESELATLGARVQTLGLDDKRVPVALPAADARMVGALKAKHDVRALPWVVVVDADGKVIATPSKHHSPTQLTQWLKADLALAL